LKGLGTSRGKVTGTARVALGLHEIGRVKHGDIMIVNSTDPGWTTVFSVISGIVLETGGMTAHGAMLAREYGLPAVQVANATRLIPDGARIEINGDSGLVILPEPEASEGETEI
jgi:pyruvate,water dikinase